MTQKLSLMDLQIKNPIIIPGKNWIFTSVEVPTQDELILHFISLSTNTAEQISFSLEKSYRRVVLSVKSSETHLYIDTVLLQGDEEDIVRLFKKIQFIAKS